MELLRTLFEPMSAGEVKYAIKIITGDLRIGLKESLVEEAIAKAFERPLDAVRRANMLTGDIGETLQAAATDTLDSIGMKLFHPIGFMLATPVETAEEILARWKRRSDGGRKIRWHPRSSSQERRESESLLAYSG